jgi:APA family basic amino acid/polyamine antiporter
MIIAPLAIIGCVGLYLNLPFLAKMVLIVWGAIGLLVYFGYSRSRSHVGRGIIDVPELDPNAPPQPVPPIGDAHTPGIKDA